MHQRLKAPVWTLFICSLLAVLLLASALHDSVFPLSREEILAGAPEDTLGGLFTAILFEIPLGALAIVLALSALARASNRLQRLIATGSIICVVAAGCMTAFTLDRFRDILSGG